jgi:hypothetical protein
MKCQGLFGKNLPAMAASGYSALAGAVLPGPPGQGAQWQKETMQSMVMNQNQKAANGFLEALNLPMEYLLKGAKYVGDIAQQVTGFTVGGVVQGGLEGAPMLMGLVEPAASVRNAYYCSACTAICY